jgi:23S rRNA (cytosine1962-C5)-methyltransferase
VVLPACCYVGGFALAAPRGGARSELALDSSEPALQQGRALAAANALSGIEFRRADVREELGVLAQAGAGFDLVVFDPPKLVPTAKHLERGRRAYRRLNAHAIALTRPGGVLVTCSCSAAMTETDFLRMLSLASGDARRELCVLRVGKQGPDHPLAPGFGEGSYLKTVFAIVR